MRRVVERGGERQPAQRQITRQHRDRADHDAERPTAVEGRVGHDAEDVGGKAVAGEGDAEPPRQRADDHEHDQLFGDVRSERRASRGVCRHGSGDRRGGAERDERAYQEARRRLEAGEGTHGKPGAKSAPWRSVSSATIVYDMRVTIEYCVV